MPFWGMLYPDFDRHVVVDRRFFVRISFPEQQLDIQHPISCNQTFTRQPDIFFERWYRYLRKAVKLIRKKIKTTAMGGYVSSLLDRYAREELFFLLKNTGLPERSP
jgi:hypothetical protein